LPLLDERLLLDLICLHLFEKSFEVFNVEASVLQLVLEVLDLLFVAFNQCFPGPLVVLLTVCQVSLEFPDAGLKLIS
jgi:hypothetical protein